MRRFPLFLTAVLFLSAGACNRSGGPCPEPPCGDDDDTDYTPFPDPSPTPTAEPPTLRPDPFPWTLQLSGVRTESLRFEEGECWAWEGRNMFQQQWFVLGDRDKIEWILTFVIPDGYYQGPATYTQAQSAVVRLKENVGGGPEFRSDSGNHAVQFRIDEDTGDWIWGEAGVTQLTDGGIGGEGTVSVSPNTIPIWCADVTR